MSKGRGVASNNETPAGCNASTLPARWFPDVAIGLALMFRHASRP